MIQASLANLNVNFLSVQESEARMGQRRGSLGKPEGKRELERRRRRWEYIIKMDLKEVGWGMDWTDLSLHRYRWRAFVNAVTNLRVP